MSFNVQNEIPMDDTYIPPWYRKKVIVSSKQQQTARGTGPMVEEEKQQQKEELRPMYMDLLVFVPNQIQQFIFPSKCVTDLLPV